MTIQQALGVFTTYHRDDANGEAGLDYAMARYYSSRSGRFMTADPGHVGANVGDPQSWNAYVYGLNDPINGIDPDGLETYRVTSELECPIGGRITNFYIGYAIWLSEADGGKSGVEISTYDTWVNGFDCEVPDTGGYGDNTEPQQGGGGAGQVNQAKAMLPAATALAVQKLQLPACSSLYGLPNTRKNYDPISVLQNIVSGKSGRIVFGPTANPTWNASTRFETHWFSSPTAVITLNPSMSWSAANTTHNAFTLLHELGHVYNGIPYLGGFALGQAAENADPFAFDRVVNQNCFGGTVNYPY